MSLDTVTYLAGSPRLVKCARTYLD